MDTKVQNKESPESLVSRIVAGDKGAEVDVVNRFHSALLVVLCNTAKDRNLAEDVAQDTWVIVLEKVRNGELRDPSKLASFIKQVGKNQLIMRYRKHAKDKNSEQIDDQAISSNEPTPEQNLANKQLNHCMKELFQELNQPRDRELLLKFYVKAEAKDQLCREYGLTHAHFDRVLHRARKRFKTLWDKANAENKLFN